MKTLYALGAVLSLSACISPSEHAVARRDSTAAPVAAVKPPIELIAVADDPGLPQPVPEFAAVAVGNSPVPGALSNRSDVQVFIAEMVRKHGFDSARLYALFSQAKAQPTIIEAITRPAEAKPWYTYRKIFVVPKRIQGGVEFWRANAATLVRAEQVYGVPPEIVVAIIGVETSYGGNTGSYRVLEALSTLAFDYPRRADFFRKELEQFLLLTREEGIDPLSLKGSYAGAMGLAQFMPSSYRAYAVDFTGDGHRDLWQNPHDAIGSVASYLGTHGWERGEPIAVPANVSGQGYKALLSKDLKPQRTVAGMSQQGVRPQDPVAGAQPAILLELDGNSGLEFWLGFNNFYVITRYNRSPLYAMAVYQLGQEIRRQYNIGNLSDLGSP